MKPDPKYAHCPTPEELDYEFELIEDVRHQYYEEYRRTYDEDYYNYEYYYE